MNNLSKCGNAIPIVMSITDLIPSTLNEDMEVPQISWKSHAEMQKAGIQATYRIVRKVLNIEQYIEPNFVTNPSRNW